MSRICTIVLIVAILALNLGTAAILAGMHWRLQRLSDVTIPTQRGAAWLEGRVERHGRAVVVRCYRQPGQSAEDWLRAYLEALAVARRALE